MDGDGTLGTPSAPDVDEEAGASEVDVTGTVHEIYSACPQHVGCEVIDEACHHDVALTRLKLGRHRRGHLPVQDHGMEGVGETAVERNLEPAIRGLDLQASTSQYLCDVSACRVLPVIHVQNVSLFMWNEQNDMLNMQHLGHRHRPARTTVGLGQTAVAAELVPLADPVRCRPPRS